MKIIHAKAMAQVPLQVMAKLLLCIWRYQCYVSDGSGREESDELV